MKKLSLQAASLFHVVMPGIVIATVLNFVFGFIVGFLEGIVGYDLPNTVFFLLLFIFSVVSYWFATKYWIKYFNARYIIDDAKQVSFVSSLYLLIVLVAYLIYTTTFEPGEMTAARIIGYVFGLILVTAVRILPFYFVSRKYLVSANPKVKSEVVNADKLPWYSKTWIILNIIYLALNTLSLLVWPNGYEGYEYATWYAVVSAIIMIIHIFGLAMLFRWKKWAFYVMVIAALVSLPFDYIATPGKFVWALVFTVVPVVITYLVIRPVWSKFK